MRNLAKLHRELVKSGLPVVSVGENYIQFYPYNIVLTPEQQATLDAALLAHDPTDYEAERRDTAKSSFPVGFKTISVSDAGNYVVTQAVGTTTEAQALAQVDSATSIATLKPVIKSIIRTVYVLVTIVSQMAQIMVVYRNHIWPELPEE